MTAAEYDAAVDAAIAETLGELQGAKVQVDCDDCGEWNGTADRCACGARRCYWNSDTLDGRVVIYPAVD